MHKLLLTVVGCRRRAQQTVSDRQFTNVLLRSLRVQRESGFLSSAASYAVRRWTRRRGSQLPMTHDTKSHDQLAKFSFAQIILQLVAS